HEESAEDRDGLGGVKPYEVVVFDRVQHDPRDERQGIGKCAGNVCIQSRITGDSVFRFTSVTVVADATVRADLGTGRNTLATVATEHLVGVSVSSGTHGLFLC